MALPLSATFGEPLGDINTTPLIDVMLVILAVLILSVPLATHSLDYDLPAPEILRNAEVRPDRNRLTITTSDAVLWNGVRVDGPQLVSALNHANARTTTVGGVMATKGYAASTTCWVLKKPAQC